MMSEASPPVFILFAPQMGENIGAVARAMSNFGLTDLRIVAPRDGWPNPAAEAMAAGGLSIIQQATIYDTLAAALHDITHLYATCARERAMDKPVVTPKQATEHFHQSPSTNHHPPKHAVLFGPERAGLSNEEIVLADAMITIPVSEQNPSLNLAQSAVVIGYEWFSANQHNDSSTACGGGKGGAVATNSDSCIDTQSPLPSAAHAPAPPQAGGREAPASKAELDGFFNHFKPLLEDVGYFREPNRQQSMWLTLRHIFNRRQMTSQEVQTLRGILRSIARKIK